MTTIRFLCDPKHEGVFPAPIPAAKAMPDWFKGIKPSSSGHPMDGTVKRCAPFTDALSAGFIIPLWTDFFVQARNGDLNVTVPSAFPFKAVEFHGPQQAPGHPLSKTPFGKHVLKFINPWLIQTDPGVSCLFTAPLNHMEGRFKILDGVVDTDGYYNNVNLPTIWTAPDGDYYLPKGLPLVQVIPFRREPNALEIGTIDLDVRAKVNAQLGTKMQHAYRTMFRHGADATPGPETET